MDLIKEWNSPEVQNAVFGEGEATLKEENGCIRVSNRKKEYSSLAVYIEKLFDDPVSLKTSVRMKTVKGKASFKVYYKVIGEYLDVRDTYYVFGNTVTVTEDEWVTASCEITVPYGTTLIHLIAYFIQSSGEQEDLLVESFDVEKVEIPHREKPVRQFDRVSMQKDLLIGTIRWDAFTKSCPDGKLPADQVARVLSPKEYHCQAPFFSSVGADGKVSFPEYTVEIWEKEAEYAHNGGLDYFAYLWYRTDDAMSQARKAHLQSSKRNLIKMCGILECMRDDKTMQELYSAMKQDCYVRLDGRAVVFLYGADIWKKEKVELLRAQAAAAGIEKPLYVVGMSTATSPLVFMDNLAKGIDAVSWYSLGAGGRVTFRELKNVCETLIEKTGALCKEHDIDLVPSFTTGRDTRARIQTGVSWCAGDPNAKEDSKKPYHNCYVLPPTMEELKEHVRFTVDWVRQHPEETHARMICSYGWNEHEEGGWLCPTLSCDENGVPDGHADTSRLDTLKDALGR